MSIISKTYGKVILFSLIAIVPLLLISNSVLSFGQTNTTNSTITTTSNQTNAAAAATDNPNSEIIKSIDSGISMIKSGDNDGAKKALYQAEASLEGQPNQSGAEKHIEASLQALKDGDTSGAITHAEEAKKGLA
jgi:hypothetical protein